MSSSSQSSAQKKTRKQKSERMINDAAEGVVGLSPLVGVRQDDLVDALKSTTVQALKQPLLAAKHSLGFAGKLVDVVAGTSSYKVGRKDRRFSDESWQESGVYKRLLQSYLALDESFEEWVTDLNLDMTEDRKARFVVDLLTDGMAPTKIC